jgi:hypothetical protein
MAVQYILMNWFLFNDDSNLCRAPLVVYIPHNSVYLDLTRAVGERVVQYLLRTEKKPQFRDHTPDRTASTPDFLQQPPSFHLKFQHSQLVLVLQEQVTLFMHGHLLCDNALETVSPNPLCVLVTHTFCNIYYSVMIWG